MVRADVEVNGRLTTLPAATIIREFDSRARIDWTITQGYYRDTNSIAGLVKDARLRLWPRARRNIRGRRCLSPATAMVCRCHADGQRTRDVDGGEPLVESSRTTIAAWTLVVPRAWRRSGTATDGMAVARGLDILDGNEAFRVLLEAPERRRRRFDSRGWSYRYSHLQASIPVSGPAGKFGKGQTIGLLGKEAGSGGWWDPHFEMKSLQPSGTWGPEAGYALTWEAYLCEHGAEADRCVSAASLPGLAKRPYWMPPAPGARPEIARRVEVDRRHFGSRLEANGSTLSRFLQ